MYSGGSGTQLNPYLIANLQDFNDINNNMSSYFKQIADISLGTFQPIGYNGGNATPIDFTGYYDGNNYKLQDAYINYPTLDYVGIFRKVTGGQIKNIKLNNINIIGNYRVGGIAGHINNRLLSIYTDITCSIYGIYYVGGIVGYADNGNQITKCSNKAIITGRYNLGGIAGLITSGTILNCYNEGEIKVLTMGATGVGGIAGYAAQNSTIQYCYNTANVIGAANIGGIVGNCYNNIYIKNCFALNSLIIRTGNNSSSIGRIAGIKNYCENNYALDIMKFTEL